MAAARAKRGQARKLFAAGVDPAKYREAAKVTLVENAHFMLLAVARERGKDIAIIGV